MENNGFLSIPAAAKKIGVSRITVYNWVKKKKLPAMRVGNVYRIKESDLAKMVTYEGAEEWTA